MTRILASLVFLLLIPGPESMARKSLTEQAQPIVAEAWKLYRSEMASWHGTDLFVARSGGSGDIGGYISYSEGSNSRCVFLSKDSIPTVIGSVSFDSSYDLQTAIIDQNPRRLSPMEADLYSLRKAAMEAISQDTFFKHYENTAFNLIPVVDGGERRVYVLTGSSKNGVVIFGNDYLLQFDKSNRLKSKRRLHKNILPFEYGETPKSDDAAGSGIHSHLPETGEFITATDICTLMLYAKLTGWTQHTVVSKKCVSIWNCRSNTLLVLPRKVMDKIVRDSEKRQTGEDRQE